MLTVNLTRVTWGMASGHICGRSAPWVAPCPGWDPRRGKWRDVVEWSGVHSGPLLSDWVHGVGSCCNWELPARINPSCLRCSCQDNFHSEGKRNPISLYLCVLANFLYKGSLPWPIIVLPEWRHMWKSSQWLKRKEFEQ